MQRSDEEALIEFAKKLGLLQKEFDKIKELLQRTPNSTELSLFASIWSGQYLLKHSTGWLKKLPRTRNHQNHDLEKDPSEQINIENSLRYTLKFQSLNYSLDPSPEFNSLNNLDKAQREVLAFGAQPVATLSSLFFGNLDHSNTQNLVHKILDTLDKYIEPHGGGHLGNKAYFHDSPIPSALINTLCIGVSKLEESTTKSPITPGNLVFLVSSNSSNNGYLSLEEFKILLDVTSNATSDGVITGLQDIYFGGISSAAAKICANCNKGMRIDLEKLSTEQVEASPSELLTSAYQGQILVLSPPEKEIEVQQLFEASNFNCKPIGEVNNDGLLEFYMQKELVANLPIRRLVFADDQHAFKYKMEKPAYVKQNKKFRLSKLPKPKDYLAVAKKLYSAPNVLSKRWALKPSSPTHSNGNYCPADATLTQLVDHQKMVAITTTCNPAYTFADPFIGTMINVAEAARNIICSGAEPKALAYSFNFGNFRDPQAYWQFVQANKGMKEACPKLDLPILGDHVWFHPSLELEEQQEPFPPTPIVGMMGLFNDNNSPITLGFKKEGDQIYMVGTPHNDVGSSEYLRTVHGIKYSPAPRFDLDEEIHILQNLKVLIQKGVINSAHDISEGGLFVSLMDCAMVNNLGFNVETDNHFRKDAYLFGESQCRILISVNPENEEGLVSYLNSNNVPFTRLGETGGHNAIIDHKDFGSVSEWKTLHDNHNREEMDVKEG